MFGIGDLITLLLAATGFGVAENPKAPTAAQDLAYAMPDAELVVHVDVASLVPGNYAALTKLADNPVVKDSPELRAAVRQILGEIEGPRGLARGMLGLDVVNDIRDITAFVRFDDKLQKPHFLLQVHANVAADFLVRTGKLVGGSPTVDGTGSSLPVSGDMTLAVAKDGTILSGDAALIHARLAASWKAPARAPGSMLAEAATILEGKPVIALVGALSDSTRRQIAQRFGQSFPTEFARQHVVFGTAVFHDGIAWLWQDRAKASFDRATMMSDGSIDLLRAAQVAPRGLAKIFVAGLAAYRGTNPTIDQLLAHQDDLLSLVTTYTGDGKFAVKTQKDDKQLRLYVRASAGHVSEVLPIGSLLPLALVGYLGERRAAMPVAAPASSGRAPLPSGGPTKTRPSH